MSKKKLLNHFQSKRPSVEDRMTAGKALRKNFHRVDQGEFEPARKRFDPVVILEEQGKTRLPDLVPIRYARMLASPFAFLRGGAAIMAADLANEKKNSGIQVQACGDMHVANFGIFASAERNIVFGINDFDETLPAPFEWDLKRLAASIVASCRFIGADENTGADCVRAAIRSYRVQMMKYATMGALELAYARIGTDDIMQSISPSAKRGAEKILNKAGKRTHMQVLDKLTDMVDDRFRLREDAPFIVRETQSKFGRSIEEGLGLFLESYFESLADDRKTLLENYRIVDVVRKVVGVGSVGTRCWVIFLIGNNHKDPLFLQVKEAQASVLEPFTARSSYSNHGQRVVAGQRLIQGAPDIFLGWGEQDGIHFYVRQLRDKKGGLEISPETVKTKHYAQYCAICGWALALAHAKSGDAAMIAGYVGKSDVLDEAMVRFGFAYADQNEKDYKALATAAKSGRIKLGAREK